MTEEAREKRNADRLTECHPWFARRLSRVLDGLEARGLRPRIQDAWRSPEAQQAAYDAGHSKLKFGFHNVTGAGGRKEALAADVLDDAGPLAPSSRYLLALAAEARAEGLETGIAWGLPEALRAGVEAAVGAGDVGAKVKVGWDPTHVQVVGLTPADARSGRRPQ